MANVQTYKANSSTNSTSAEQERQRRAILPRVDIFENEAEFLVYADLPGVAKEDLAINIHRDQLTVEASRKEALASGVPLAGEFRAADYRRTFALPQGVDRDKVEADINRGVLRLRLPKNETTRPRQVQVRSA